MSIHSLKVYWFACDKCGVASSEYQCANPGEARYEANTDGWTVLNNNSTRCPQCSGATK